MHTKRLIPISPKKPKKNNFAAINEAITEAISKNDLPRIKEFTAGQLIAYPHDKYKNAFLFAIRKASMEMAREIAFIVAGDSNSKLNEMIYAEDTHGRSAMVLASIADSPKRLAYLGKQYEIKINDHQYPHKSPLCYAIINDSKKAFKWLLQKGVAFTDHEQKAINENDNFKAYFNSPKCFLSIVEAGNQNAFKYIMRHIKGLGEEEQDTFFSVVDEQGKTPLILAADRDHHLVVKLILDSGLVRNLLHADTHGHTALYYLGREERAELALKYVSTVGEIKPSEAMVFADCSNKLSTTTKDSLVKIGNALTNAKGASQAGRVPKIAPEKYSPYRSYKSERALQLLRQASTQVHLYAANIFDEDQNLVEVQMMYVNFGGKDKLFVAANDHAVTPRLSMLINSKKKFKEVMTSTHEPTKDKEGTSRTWGIAGKMNVSVYSEEINLPIAESKEDGERANKIALLLREASIRPLILDLGGTNMVSDDSLKEINTILQHNQKEICFVVVKNCPHQRRHAEQFLTDIAECAISLGKELGIEVDTSVAGKKRPCIGCYARMDGVINHIGTNPGLFWGETIRNQKPSAIPRTIKVLLTVQPSITLCKDNKTTAKHYGSGSDTESEDRVRRQIVRKR